MTIPIDFRVSIKSQCICLNSLSRVELKALWIEFDLMPEKVIDLWFFFWDYLFSLLMTFLERREGLEESLIFGLVLLGVQVSEAIYVL